MKKKSYKIRRKESKKSQGNIIAVILIILLVLIAIFFLWRIVFPMADETKQEIEIRDDLSKTRMGITDVSGDLIAPIGKEIEITLTRGSGELNILNQTMKNYTINRIILVPVNRTINVTELQNVTETKTINGTLDLAFVIDTTGSMSEDIKAVKKIIQNFTMTLYENNVIYRFALVEFKDYPNSPCGSPGDFPSKVYQYSQGNFTNNLTEFNNSLNLLNASGGNDGPESHLTAVNDASNLGFSATKNIIILLTDSQPHAKDCFTSLTSSSTWFACYLGPEYIKNMTDKLNSKKISLYYLNYNTCYNKADVKLANETGGEYFFYNASSASVDVPKILMNISDQINVTQLQNVTELRNVTVPKNVTVQENVTDYINQTITEVIYEPVGIWQSLKAIVYNDTSSYVYTMPKDTPILAPLESMAYTIGTGSVTNINKIEIYLVVTLESGKEISELVATWTPGTESPESLPSY